MSNKDTNYHNLQLKKSFNLNIEERQILLYGDGFKGLYNSEFHYKEDK